jgi:pilus assembly protein Flp/PilA
MPRFICWPLTAVRRIFADRTGATAIEYALIAGVIAAAIVGAVTAIGTSLAGIFNNLGTIAASAL